MIEPVKFIVYVPIEKVQIFVDLLTKKKIKNEVMEFNAKFKVVKITMYPQKHFDKDIILELYNEGKSYSNIAEIVGCSKSYVQKVINENADDD